MNTKLDQLIADKKLEAVTGKVFAMKGDAGHSVRVMCNTKTGQAIFIKHFTKHDNIIIDVNDKSQGSNDGFYINQFTQGGELIPAFNDSLDVFIKKGPSLAPTEEEQLATKAIEV